MMSWYSAFSRRNLARLLVLCALSALLAGCGVNWVMQTTLPESDGTIPVTTSLRQPFYSSSDNLNRLSIGIVPRAEDVPGESPRIAGGAVVELAYAPEADNRYPDGDFHDWPAEHDWLGELTGERVASQTFTSLYANLSGITLRVATYGSDLSPGLATLEAGAPVQVRALPVDGAISGALEGGSQIYVESSVEGWARVRLDDGGFGFVALDSLADLPEPERHNDQDIHFALYEQNSTEPLREVTINAAEITDNSHLTFGFEPITESAGAVYRFTVSSPGSEPGNAITIRYSAADIYDGGKRYERAEPADGDLIFRPQFGPSAPLYQAALDDFIFSGQTNTLDRSFDPIPETGERFLALTVRAVDSPVELIWTRIRPPGVQPLTVEGNPNAPAGGLLMNAGFQSEISPVRFIDETAVAVRDFAGDDPGFFVFYTAVIAAIVGGWLFIIGRRVLRGR